MSTCNKARNFYLKWDIADIMGVDILFGENGTPNDGTNFGKECVSHLQVCCDCKSWLKTQVPDDEITRYSVMHKYCCTGMFHSVEEPGFGSVSIKSGYFRGEYVWFVKVASDTVGGNLIQFCPWCGRKLPESSFLDDVSSKG